MTYSKNLVYNNMTVNFNNIRIERADADSRDHICYLLDSNKKVVATLLLNDKRDIKLDFKSDWNLGNRIQRNLFFKLV